MKKTADNMQIKKFLSYVIVGGLATIVEWVCYWIFRQFLLLQYMFATVFAIVISTLSNWLFGRLITFRGLPGDRIFVEILKIYAASSVGLLLNMLLMWILYGRMHMEDTLSKIIATGIVFLYNYLVRISLIYKNKQKSGYRIYMRK